ncbi:hypothetical protein [Limnohabitans sp.]|uniref:hypothetical protein n=1 Tax=Limnohabitans sp. TaxID=1907725 RepID=UPI00334235EE
MNQREAAEKQRSMLSREDALRGSHYRDAALNMAQQNLGEQRKQSGVTREMQQLEKNLHILAAAIDNLENRLMPVCLPIPETASGLRTSDGGGCALANQLAAFNSMLSVQTARIEMIYQGVDL